MAIYDAFGNSKSADAFSIEKKRNLMIFLLRSLRGIQGALPTVRDIPKETIEKWIKDDEAGYQKFLDSKIIRILGEVDSKRVGKPLSN